MTDKTYTLEVLDRYGEARETSVYENLSKEMLEKMIAGLYVLKLCKSAVDFTVFSSKNKKVKWNVSVKVEIEDGEKKYPIPLPVDYTALPEVDTNKAKLVDKVVKEYWKKQPKRILKKAKRSRK
jgi:hypothetical protein